MKKTNKYNDIINLPHYQSKKHPHMSIRDRAAQFAPFAALTGHEEAIDDTRNVHESNVLLSQKGVKIEGVEYYDDNGFDD